MAMTSSEEIMQLKKTEHDLELKIEKLDKKQQPIIARLYRQLSGIIDDLELIQNKEKIQHNPAMATRIKLARKGRSFVKELISFDAEVEKEFKSQKLSDDNARRFSSIITLIRINKIEEAKEELNHFKSMVDLEKDYEKTKDEIAKTEKDVKAEQMKIEIALNSIEALEKEVVNQKKVERYEELLKSIEELKIIRTQYIHSLLSKQVRDLIKELSEPRLKEHHKIILEKQYLNELNSFLLEYPIFGKCTVVQLGNYLDLSEKKLSYICPEVSRFRKIVLENKKMFETLASLEQTDFLAVDENNEKTMNFYKENIKGASEIVERIIELKKDEEAGKKEYEKKEKIEKQRSELEKYSKTSLENELKTSKNLLELLRSEPAHEEIPETKKETKSLFSGINTFIKKLSGK